MQPPVNGLIATFLDEEQLPDSFVEIISSWYQPLAAQLIELQKKQGRPLIVGINGAQGTGKSTLAKYLSLMLTQQQLTVANLSLDDFYLDSNHREQLAREIHPLLATRGVPGTHDLKMAEQILEKLANPHSRGQLLLPRFDKAIDEPRPQSQWDPVELPVDVVLLEGWFACLPPQAQELLDTPVNALEADEDSSGTWRYFVNKRLSDYQSLFRQIDFLVMLKAPSFDCVYQWRSLQEQKLAAIAGTAGNKVMDRPSLDRFIQHFERLTRHCLDTLPEQADLVFFLDSDHQIIQSHPPLP